MVTGRPPKSTALKKLQGTFRDDRAVTNEMMPELITHVPSAPTYFSKIAKLEWVSVCEQLIEMESLHRVDLALLSAYCVEMASYLEAIKAIKKEGSVITLPGKAGEYKMQNPWVGVKNSALKNAQTLANQFGFTPAARSKISISPKEKESEFEKMRKMDDD